MLTSKAEEYLTRIETQLQPAHRYTWIGLSQFAPLGTPGYFQPRLHVSFKTGKFRYSLDGDTRNREQALALLQEGLPD